MTAGLLAAGCTGSRGSVAGVTHGGPLLAGSERGDAGRTPLPPVGGISQSPLPVGRDGEDREFPPPNTGALAPAPERAAARVMERHGTSLQPIHFAFDQYTLTAEAREILSGSAESLRRSGGIGVLIEGHCDERGTTEYNLALGDRRASSARQYLEDLGIAGERLDTVTYGEERPLDPGRGEAAWARNRRAEFVTVRP